MRSRAPAAAPHAASAAPECGNARTACRRERRSSRWWSSPRPPGASGPRRRCRTHRRPASQVGQRRAVSGSAPAASPADRSLSRPITRPDRRLQQRGQHGEAGGSVTPADPRDELSSTLARWRGSGSTSWHSPACAIGARHAPHHAGRLVLRDRGRRRRPPRGVPASPSWPMPVSITTSTRPPQAAAALRSIGSTAGRQKFSGGSSVTRAANAPPASACHQQVPVAGRQTAMWPAAQALAVRAPRRRACRPAG